MQQTSDGHAYRAGICTRDYHDPRKEYLKKDPFHVASVKRKYWQINDGLKIPKDDTSSS